MKQFIDCEIPKQAEEGPGNDRDVIPRVQLQLAIASAVKYMNEKQHAAQEEDR